MKNRIICEVKRVDRKAALFLEKKLALRIKRERPSNHINIFLSWFDFMDELTKNRRWSDGTLSMHFVNSFVWYRTPQGHDYWERIYWKLGGM